MRLTIAPSTVLAHAGIQAWLMPWPHTCQGGHQARPSAPQRRGRPARAQSCPAAVAQTLLQPAALRRASQALLQARALRRLGSACEKGRDAHQPYRRA